MNLAAFVNDLFAVVVLFRSAPGQPADYSSILRALRIDGFMPEVLVYDNSPDPLYDVGVPYIHDGSNGGLSKAYNTACALALQRKKQWLLILDQDTVLPDDFLCKIYLATQKHPASLVFACRVEDVKGLLSPFALSYGRGRRINPRGDVLPLSRYRFINSGVVVNCRAFDEAGGYDEEIPLDFSDIAFGARLRNITDHFILVDTTLRQDFADNRLVATEDALQRFNFFCRGALAYGRKSEMATASRVHILGRALRLALRYRDMRFFSTSIERILYG